MTEEGVAAVLLLFFVFVLFVCVFFLFGILPAIYLDWPTYFRTEAMHEFRSHSKPLFASTKNSLVIHMFYI